MKTDVLDAHVSPVPNYLFLQENIVKLGPGRFLLSKPRTMDPAGFSKHHEPYHPLQGLGCL